MLRPLLAAVLSVLAVGGCAPIDEQVDSPPRVLLLVVDGLRPDYVTAERMPRLHALGAAGVRGLRHHAVFPTVTRVNAPSIFTGRYPSGHGGMGNDVYLPDVEAGRVLDAGDRADLLRIEEAQGRLLTAPTLGEMLADGGKVLFAASSGSSGSATLMNPTGAGAGLVHHAVVLPDTLGPVVEDVLGPVSREATGLDMVARTVDAALRIGLDGADADVLALWLTEPDGTAHDHGMAALETRAMLERVDREIGRLLDGLEERGVLASTHVLVTSDHGFSTRVGEESLEELLVRAGIEASEESMDVVVAGDAIHLPGGDPALRDRVVEVLQRTAWIGPVFTRGGAGSLAGEVEGTASLAAAAWDHPRSAPILTSPNWTDQADSAGFRGRVLSPGVAGHGSSSPWDIRATFLAAGPAFRAGVDSRVPTGNVDLTPTVLHLMGLEAPAELDGRVLEELFVDGPDPASVAVTEDTLRLTRELSDLTYALEVHRAAVDGRWYLGGTRVTRTPRGSTP